MITVDDKSQRLERVEPLIRAAKEELRQNPIDLNRIRAAKDALLRGHESVSGAISLAGILAVVSNDRRAWSYVEEALGKNIDPALGYVSFMRAHELLGDGFNESDWLDIIQSAANSGFIEAKLFLRSRRINRGSIFGKISYFMLKSYYAMQVWNIARLDKDDLRLPLKTRQR